jgi:diguanylate cyclase (GGDEF)-like protein
MIETRLPIIVSDVSRDPAWVYSRPEHHWIQSYVGAPIITQGTIAGFLNVISATPNMYDQTHADRLLAFAYHAAIAIENARLYRQAQAEIKARIAAEEELCRHRDHLEELVKERTAEIRRMAITDSLTQLFNRRHLMELGVQSVNYAHRYQRSLTAMMIDIDHFKQINDAYGHAAGDETLRQLAGLLQRTFRSADVVGRYGGEEFVVLTPEIGLRDAQRVAERFMTELRALRVVVPNGEIGITASLGIAEYDPACMTTLDELINLADQAMYAAKQSGRDRVVVHQNHAADMD